MAATTSRGCALVARGEFSILLAQLGVGAGLDAQLGPMVTAYVLLCAISGPLLARSSDALVDALRARRLHVVPVLKPSQPRLARRAIRAAARRDPCVVPLPAMLVRCLLSHTVPGPRLRSSRVSARWPRRQVAVHSQVGASNIPEPRLLPSRHSAYRHRRRR